MARKPHKPAPTPAPVPPPAPAPAPTPQPAPPAPVASDAAAWGIPDFPELRPDNTPYNRTRGHALPDTRSDPAAAYTTKVTGAFSGTTWQILLWAAKKWGFDALGFLELFCAEAIAETGWKQWEVGDSGHSFGILQVKDIWWPSPDHGTLIKASTAYAADFAAGMIRAHYDGAFVGWTDQCKGSIERAVAAWYSGAADGFGGGGQDYWATVQNYLAQRSWTHAGF